MSKRDGVDAVPGEQKRRSPRRPRPASGPSPSDASGPTAPDSSASRSSGPRSSGPRSSGPRSSGPRSSGPRSSGPRFAKPLSPAGILGWTALSVIAPGAAHLRAGRRRTGLVLFAVYAVLLLAALAYVLVNGVQQLAPTFAADNMMVAAIVGLSALGLAWFAIVVLSYVVLNPRRLNQMGQILSGVAVGVLCVAVMSPFAVAANTVLTLRDTIHTIFPSAPDPDTPNEPVKNPEDPWNGKTRVNFLLIGGDAAGNRTGVRTDSMNVASVDVRTGDTVLFSLPRNLQHVHFPPSSPLRKQFPNGFMAELPNGGLLNEVWQYANDNPQLMGGRNKGARALMDAIGYTLDLKIDYYALMNMYGFADLVDAIGGLKIRVERDVKWGGHFGTAGTIKAGYRKLSGEEALWYGRSRVDSDDFSRMARQRCVIGAFAQQATPAVILTNFTKIAGAAKRMAQTNIPQHLVQPLVELAVKVKDAKITSLQFVPPEFYSGRPDWMKIRRYTKKAIEDSGRPARRAQAAGVTASPGTTAGGPSATPTRTRAATPTQTPTRNTQRAAAKSLSELCGL
ncbi:LCP family protein [Nonomuraea pusilla]|uniref:Transcriptional attenuator, LytR family n=1 Tax=Nonomuraea pusilla TaxID=46177 RepID=A0A1H7XY07_9ACTN|nr:LCP family protein [Nonomuraea pusilla]SEM38504.1 transcriptional attenuator, LytR family [Nonomuraea pusilla]